MRRLEFGPFRAMAKIIISYRRSDSDVFAGRVRDRIAGHAIPILTMFGCYMLTRDVSSDYLSTCVALAVIQSTASLLVAKPSIRRSWPSWYLMTTCQPVPVLSRKGSITGFSSESGMYAICTWALATASPAFDYEMRHRIDRCENGFA